MTFDLFEALLDESYQDSDLIGLIGPDLELSYSELIQDSKLAAGWLREHGFNPGDMALVSLSKESELIIMLGIIHEGGVSAHFSENLKQLDLAALGFRFLITNSPEISIPGIKTLVLSREQFLAVESNNGIATIGFPSEGSTVRVIFSSGTTGLPKAVPITVSQTLRRAEAFESQIIQNKSFMSFLGFDVSLGYITAMADLLSRRPHILAGPAQSALRLASELKVKNLAMSPIALMQLTEAVKSRNLQLTWAVEQIFTAGGPVSIELAATASQELNVNLVSIYGSTEVGLVARREGSPTNELLAGKILPHAKVEIVDEQDRILAEGMQGEVRLSLPWQSSSYLGNPEKTAEHFRGGYFFPGDTGFIQQGQLFITGRSNLVLNLGGVKLDPAVIEQLLTDAFGLSSIVMSLLEGSAKPIRLVIGSHEEVSEDDLVARVERYIGMRGLVAVNRLDDVPRNSMGKPNRQILSLKLSKLQ